MFHVRPEWLFDAGMGEVISLNERRREKVRKHKRERNEATLAGLDESDMWRRRRVVIREVPPPPPRAG